MPTTPGFGTGYFARRSIEKRMGECERCGRVTELASFDATQFYVAFWVPVLPLGRYRVYDECSSCRTHRCMRLADWKRLCENKLRDRFAAYAAEPTSVEKAGAAVGAAVSAGNAEAFDSIAPLIERSLGNNADARCILAEGHVCFGRPDLAEAQFRRAVQLDTGPGSRRALSVHLMRFGRADEARPLIQDILEQRDEQNIGFPYLLTQAYMQQGQHSDARRLLDEVAAAMPSAASTPEYIDLDRMVQANLDGDRPIPSPLLADPAPRREPDDRGSATRAYLGGPAMALALLVLYLGIAYLVGRNRTVYLVSGLSTPYEVEINGQRHRMAPFQATGIRLSEGTVSVRVLDPAMKLPEQTGVLHTPIFTRIFRDPTFVINPDRVALVYTQPCEYVRSGSLTSSQPDQEDPRYRLFTNSMMHTVYGMDYEFRDFPASLTVKSHTSKVTKLRLTHAQDVTPLAAVAAVHRKLGDASAAEYLRTYSNLRPGDELLLAGAVGHMPREQALAMLRSRLAERPVLVVWHRAYQQLADPDGQNATHGEYKAMLAADPRNLALAYLLGRVTENRAEARTLFEQAAAGDPPLAWAHHALAFDLLCAGDFGKAREFWRKARAIDPQNRTFKAYEGEALEALGQYDELLREARAGTAANPNDFASAQAVCYALACMGQIPAAREQMESALKRWSPRISRETAARFSMELAATIAYAGGDTDGYVRQVNEESGAAEQFGAAITAGKLDEAATRLAKTEDPHGMGQLMLCLAAHVAGDTAKARQCLDAGIAQLRKGPRHYRTLAAWLAKEKVPSDEELAAWTLASEERRVGLACLALVHASDRPRLTQLALKANFSRTFPYWLIRKAMGPSGGLGRAG